MCRSVVSIFVFNGEVVSQSMGSFFVATLWCQVALLSPVWQVRRVHSTNYDGRASAVNGPYIAHQVYRMRFVPIVGRYQSLVCPRSRAFPVVVQYYGGRLRHYRLTQELRFYGVGVKGLLTCSGLFYPRMMVVSNVLGCNYIRKRYFGQRFVPVYALRFSFFRPYVYR